MKVREIVSEIQNDLRTVNNDEWLSRRFIFNKLKSLVSYYIAQEDLYKLLKESNLFVNIDCVEMEEKLFKECCNINILNLLNVMKSKKLIDLLLLTMYGDIIKVYNIEGDEYKKTNLISYRNMKKSEFLVNKRFFWIENDYIIILESEVEVISVWGLFFDKSKAKSIGSCNENNFDNKPICSSLLDEDFTCLEKLLAIVKEKALTQLLNSVRRINNDNLQNVNTNIK